MKSLLFVVISILIIRYSAVTAQNINCTVETESSGKIIDILYTVNEERCWIIRVPRNSILTLKVKVTFERTGNNGLEINVLATGENYVFNRSNAERSIIAFSDVKITHYARNSRYRWESNFTLYYEITTDPRIEGQQAALDVGISWLKQQRTSSWGWHENTPRAVVALYLASAVKFNGSNIEEDLMSKETELVVLVALLRPSVSSNDLSLFINALLVICHNPRRFHGVDLVQRLKTQVETTRDSIDPVVYLALCNADERWPTRAFDDLEEVLCSNSIYSFVRDIQAVAIMAVSCLFSRQRIYNAVKISNLRTLHEITVDRFKTLQREDGSFGNVYTTALITQALVSSGEGFAKDWNSIDTMEYLIEKLKSTTTNFLLVYFTLPILNGKSLVDVAYVDGCLSDHMTHDEEFLREVNDYLGEKMRVKYSLYLGDEINVIYTISLMVPKNFTAYLVMKLAEIQDPKYSFKWKMIQGKMYVYEIANILNDPEHGKFWLQYVGTTKNKVERLQHVTTSPDKLNLNEGDHLVMWYKSASI